MRRHVDGLRLAAFQQLLALPDPSELKRGHRWTQAGTRNRLSAIWYSSARVWMQRQIGSVEGASSVVRFAKTRRVGI